jgi:hypothetical protein
MKAASSFQSVGKLASALIISMMLCACVPTTPQWDKQFGESVRLVRIAQIMNPEAGGDAPVNGIDGAAARESIGRYRSSFREPPPAPTPLTSGAGR